MGVGGDPCERAFAIGLPQPPAPGTNREFGLRLVGLVHPALLGLACQSAQALEAHLPAILQKPPCSRCEVRSHSLVLLASWDLANEAHC